MIIWRGWGVLVVLIAAVFTCPSASWPPTSQGAAVPTSGAFRVRTRTSENRL